MHTMTVWIDTYNLRWDSNAVSLYNIGVRRSSIDNLIVSEWVSLVIL